MIDEISIDCIENTNKKSSRNSTALDFSYRISTTVLNRSSESEQPLDKINNIVNTLKEDPDKPVNPFNLVLSASSLSLGCLRPLLSSC